MHKKALLFLNGNPPQKNLLRWAAAHKNDIFTVAADGGFCYLREYFLPDVVVADFDSSSDLDVPPEVEVVRLKKEKDYTDGHAALEYITERGITDITIYGADGGRADHILANYSLLALAARLGASAKIDTDDFTIRLISGDFDCQTELGKIVSLVPFTDTVHINYTKGLKYPLFDYQLDKVHILGISNEASDQRIEVSTKSGAALIFVQK